MKANHALNALKLIRKYFNVNEILQLIMSNFYSVLYYNSEVWHINHLKQRDKLLLLSTSSKALKMAANYSDPLISNDRVHGITKRATLEMYCNYKLSL